ncbi:MAG: protein kinase [Acidobacteria bacterium]|nr:protein kinase [Acidobacteriota bacterium]
MKPEHWQQLDQLLEAALERPSAARAAFLAEACAGNETLRQEVESLLRADARAASFIETPAAALAAEALAQQPAWDALTAPSWVGQRLGHYEMLALLGAGGMGEVYLAQDVQLGRKVALKLLPARFTVEVERVRRFEREARTVSALNHPNILTIYEIGTLATEAGETHFIATEFIDGQTLRERLHGGRLELNEALDLTLQIVGALSVAHAANIIHRDIKPENVMVRRDGLVKVLDFGLAKLNEAPVLPANSSVSTLEKLSTEPGAVMGTVAYMSPEQARGQKADARSDLFSLGVLLFEMLAGQRPFAGATTSDVIAAVLTAEPPPLRQPCAAASAELEQIIGKCLSKEREARYQSAEELIVALKALQSGSQVEGTATSRQLETAKARFASWRWPAIAGLAAVLMAGLVWFLVWRRVPPDQIKSLAVLPLRPLQAGTRDEALELGTTSTLITRLGSLRQLIVRPESAVEKYARADQDPLAAGREQKVDAVLDNRYQRVGDKLRFRLRLLRVADGATLWADTLDQQTTDSFAIEDALSAKVTGGLKLTLSEAEKELLAKRYTKSAEAWQLYVRGRLLLHTRRIPDIEKAITYFEQAIALDPGFALAYAKLGHAYASLSWVGQAPPKELAPKTKAALDQALKLDDQLAEAHAHLAEYKHYYEWDFAGAELEHKCALELNPSSADVRQAYAFYLTYMGRFEQAIPEIKKAEELDPTSIWISRNVAQTLYFARRYDDAIEQSRRVIDLHPNSGPAYNWLIKAWEMKGDEQSAFAAYLKRAEANRASPDELAGMKVAFASGGLKGYRRWELDRRLAREKSRYVGHGDIAIFYAQLGEKEQALARLQRAVEDRTLYVVTLTIEPQWDSYRTDPRFVALVRRVGLVP